MARARTKSNRRATGGTLDAEAIKQANKRKRADGKKRCYACLKGSTTRCLQVCSGASDFCLVHSGWLSKIFAGDLGYSRFIDSDDELELSESENEGPKPQKKKQKPRKEKKKKKKKDIEEYESEEEEEVFPSQALPARLITDSNEVEPLGLLDDVLNFVPTLTKGAKPTSVEDPIEMTLWMKSDQQMTLWMKSDQQTLTAPRCRATTTGRSKTPSRRLFG
jgi:hypothetical protein